MRLFLLPAVLLISAIAMACGGDSATTDDDSEPTSTAPANTVTPTTPIPAPPWATNGPSGETPAATSAEPTATSTSAPATNTPGAVANTAVPTQPAPPPPAPTEPPAPTATPRLLQTIDVTVVNDRSFSPNRIEIPAGSTVNFSWNGDVPHTVASSGAGFASGDPAKADSLSVIFTTPGTFSFICETHPTTMRGVITVTP